MRAAELDYYKCSARQQWAEMRAIGTYWQRARMRRYAKDYAELRGWTVALTPPQRQKGQTR